jgi:FKBP-type peptidyl-prolyl cis-trans isomerase SlyD
MSDSEITTGSVVHIHYTLTNDSGEELDSSRGGRPLGYLHGAGNIVPGLERQIEGKRTGDRFVAVVPAAEGYGERRGPGPQPVPRTAFPPNVRLHAGMQFVTEDDQGEELEVWVTEVSEDMVLIDFEHPLAGEVLHFEVEIVSVRDATAQEKQHGHIHDGGHDH